MDKIFTYFSAARTMLEQQSALNSGSHVSRKVRSSLIIPRTLELLIRAKHNSIARLKEIVKKHILVNINYVGIFLEEESSSLYSFLYWL